MLATCSVPLDDPPTPISIHTWVPSGDRPCCPGGHGRAEQRHRAAADRLGEEVAAAQEDDGLAVAAEVELALGAAEAARVLDRAQCRRAAAADGHDVVIDELRAESGASHALHGVGVEVIAANLDAGEYLLETKTGPDAFAVVRLTWSGKRERGLPVQFFRSWAEWAQRYMRPRKE